MRFMKPLVVLCALLTVIFCRSQECRRSTTIVTELLPSRILMLKAQALFDGTVARMKGLAILTVRIDSVVGSA